MTAFHGGDVLRLMETKNVKQPLWELI